MSREITRDVGRVKPRVVRSHDIYWGNKGRSRSHLVLDADFSPALLLRQVEVDDILLGVGRVRVASGRHEEGE